MVVDNINKVSKLELTKDILMFDIWIWTCILIQVIFVSLRYFIIQFNNEQLNFWNEFNLIQAFHLLRVFIKVDNTYCQCYSHSPLHTCTLCVNHRMANRSYLIPFIIFRHLYVCLMGVLCSMRYSVMFNDTDALLW